MKNIFLEIDDEKIKRKLLYLIIWVSKCWTYIFELINYLLIF